MNRAELFFLILMNSTTFRFSVEFKLQIGLKNSPKHRNKSLRIFWSNWRVVQSKVKIIFFSCQLNLKHNWNSTDQKGIILKINNSKIKYTYKKMISTTRLFLVLFLATFSLPNTVLSLKEGECEVCINVLEKFTKDLSEDVMKDPKKIETEFRKFCKTSKTKENRFVSFN